MMGKTGFPEDGGDSHTMSTLFQKYPFSDLVHIFPVMSREEFSALVASIRVHGLLEPIMLWRGEIIDGRHRFLACIKAGVEPRFERLPDDADPREYVLAKNRDRRDTSASQKAVSAYKVTLRSGPGRPRREDRDNAERPYTQQEAAKRFGVSRSMVNAVARLMSEESRAIPAVLRAVEQGRIAVNDAGKVADEPPEIQREALARVVRGKPTTIARAVGQVKRETVQREDSLALESTLARPIGETVTLHHAAVADLHNNVAPASVNAIITHPPAADERSLTSFSDLASFAAHALRPDGVMVVVASASSLPQFMEGLRHPDLRWALEMDIQFSKARGRSGRPHFINVHRRPLLVYGKMQFRLTGGDDVIAVPAPEELSEGQERWHPVEVGMSMLVERFTRPGQVVCDPFLLGWRGTALGARRNGCSFIGGERDRSCLDRTRGYLVEAEGSGAS